MMLKHELSSLGDVAAHRQFGIGPLPEPCGLGNFTTRIKYRLFHPLRHQCIKLPSTSECSEHVGMTLVLINLENEQL